jgi:hypothetical protein
MKLLVYALFALVVSAHGAHAQNATDALWLSLRAPATLGGIAVEPNDVVACQPAGDGNATTCKWSLVFDGSDVGFFRGGIGALEALPDGRLLMRLTDAQQLPGIGELVTANDIVLFTPTALGPNTTGTWSVYMDGDRFGARGREWDGLSVHANGNLLFSPPRNGADDLLPGLRDEDVISCAPTAFDIGGVIVACTYQVVFDASTAGIGVGADLGEFDLTPAGLLFVASAAAGLPPHEAFEDILFRNASTGQVSVYLNGSGAGLNRARITGLSFAPSSDSDGDGVPDVSDNCPQVANPAQEDADGDRTGDVCDACPNVAGGVPQPLNLRRLLLAFPGGLGGGNDRLQKLAGSFRVGRPLELGGNDALHLTVSRAEDPSTLIFAGRARPNDGQWQQFGSPGPNQRWLFRGPTAAGGGIRSAAVRRRGVGGFVNRLKLRGAATSLSALPLTRRGRVRALLEISNPSAAGMCFEQVLRCKRPTVARQLCRP